MHKLGCLINLATIVGGGWGQTLTPFFITLTVSITRRMFVVVKHSSAYLVDTIDSGGACVITLTL